MDISFVFKNCIKLKGKKTSFIIDPQAGMPEISAEAVLLTGSAFDISRVPGSRLVINGVGEYEVGGSKISAVANTHDIIYRLSMDNLTVILGRTVDFSKLEGKFTACDIAIINVDDQFSESFVASLGPKIVVLYGERTGTGAKKLGLNNITSVVKLSIVKDKLPEEMQVVALG